jgi:hypothetical protein
MHVLFGKLDRTDDISHALGFLHTIAYLFVITVEKIPPMIAIPSLVVVAVPPHAMANAPTIDARELVAARKSKRMVVVLTIGDPTSRTLAPRKGLLSKTNKVLRPPQLLPSKQPTTTSQ